MRQYRLITDSTADLTASYLEERNIGVVCLSYLINGVETRDELKVESHRKFYAAMRENAVPITAQVTSDQFIEYFQPELEKGYDIVYVAFSSGLSGTCQGAQVAAKELKERFPERKIFVCDTLAASMGEGLIVHEAANLRDSGYSAEALYQWLEENKMNMKHWFTVKDLSYLFRGGRCSATSAFVGTLMDIKPVLDVNNEGKLIPRDRVKGRKRSIKAMMEHMREEIVNPDGQTVAISHGDCIEDAEFLASLIREEFKVKDIIINYVGSVIGAHSGPGTLALFFWGNPRKF